MSKRRKIFLWLGLLISLPAGGYSGLSVVFYAWLDASQQWPTENAAVWGYGFFALTVLFMALFVYCLVSLIKEANRQYKVEQNAI